MKINCISCGYKVDLDDAYTDYEGPVKCYVCGNLLQMKCCDGKLKSLHLYGAPPSPLPKHEPETQETGSI